jgi:pimeloyl-ACP methyl ester carboxylesterase
VALLGHSYGGSIITAVADQLPERISALNYLDAVIPTHGVPGWQGFPPDRQQAMLAGAQALGGLRVPPPDPALWGFVPGTPDHQDLQQRLTPHPIKTMTDAPRLAGLWKLVVHKHYLLAAGPPASRFAGLHAALTGEMGWTTALVTGGHEMMWTHPRELAASLLPLINASH